MFAEQMILANYLVERLWPQPVGKRPWRTFREARSLKQIGGGLLHLSALNGEVIYLAVSLYRQPPSPASEVEHAPELCHRFHLLFVARHESVPALPRNPSRGSFFLPAKPHHP